MTFGEVTHFLYATVGLALVIWCLYTVATPRRRMDRTTTIVLLMSYNICLLCQNFIVALGNVIGEGDTLLALSRVRLGMNAVGPPVFLITLTLLAEKTKVSWPCANFKNKEQEVLIGQVMVGLGVLLGLLLCAFAMYRDMVLDLHALTTEGGCLVYSPRHNEFGFASEEIQEWLPSLILLLWSLPLALLIQNKGGLRWYRNRYYGFIPLFEIAFFVARLMPEKYTTQFSCLTDLILLVSFMVCENKLVGEYREVKELKVIIERVQESKGRSGGVDGVSIVEFLNLKYPPDEKLKDRKLRQRTSMATTGDHLMDIIKRPFSTEEVSDNVQDPTRHDALMSSVIRLKEENSTYRKILKQYDIPLPANSSPRLGGRALEAASLLSDDVTLDMDGDSGVGVALSTTTGAGVGMEGSRDPPIGKEAGQGHPEEAKDDDDGTAETIHM